MYLTFSNFLTLTRILLIPWIGYAVVQRVWLCAIVLFLIAAITDLLDGYLARKWKQETKLGACLDPLADKLLIITCYAALVYAPIEGLTLPGWFLCIVLVKEIILLLGAFYFAILKHEVEVRPTLLGKFAMFVQSSLIAWMLVCSIFHWMPIRTFSFVLWITLALIIGSLFHYGYSLAEEKHE